MNPKIAEIKDYILPLRELLLEHPVYKQLRHLNDLNILMEQHVFAVWDFMALLKSLQFGLTSTNAPWMPIGNPKTRRLINEIVLEEESDIDIKGNPSSHYEMYLQAMQQSGANTQQVERFISRLLLGYSHKELLKFNVERIKEYTLEFVNTTFEIIERKKLHEIASAFTFGREDLIPDMFIEILKNSDAENKKYNKLIYYLERHIEIDGDEHGPLSLKMVAELCGNDSQKWDEAQVVAKKSLEKRILLWDAISDLIEKKI